VSLDVESRLAHVLGGVSGHTDGVSGDRTEGGRRESSV
jgi:hypothetical protein